MCSKLFYFMNARFRRLVDGFDEFCLWWMD